VTRYLTNGYDLYNANQVRLAYRSKFRREYEELEEKCCSLKNSRDDLQRELNEQKHINSELVSILNNFSKNILNSNEIFTSNSYFTKYDLPSCEQKLDKIFAEVGKKSENQLALVTRSSTDLSITKETLRLTQVANLVLQKQISDNKEDYQQKLDDKQKQIEEKKKELKQGLELYKKKEDEVKDLNKKNDELKDKNAELREEKVTAEIKLKSKEEEVDRLRSKLGQSEEEFLESKIRLKQERLELFADRLGVNLEKIQTLRELFEQEINARSSINRKEVERKITQIKQELRTKIKMEDVQEICSRCEEIAELQIELEKLHYKQYQAHQEQPTNQ